MDHAFRDQDAAWEGWKRGKGTEEDRLRWKTVKRTGKALERAQQEGVVNFLEAHALEPTQSRGKTVMLLQIPEESRLGGYTSV